MKRVFGAALVLAMMLSVTSIAFAETGSMLNTKKTLHRKSLLSIV